MRVGYARVSTREQAESLQTQREALEALGCTRVYTDVASGARADRPGLADLLDRTYEGDAVYVTRLDRLGRTTLDTLRTLTDLDARGITVTAADTGLDTSTSSGRLVIRVMLSLAEWERDVLIERTREGLAHARSQGRTGGRPRKLGDVEVQAIRAALETDMSPADVATMHGVSTRTISRVRAGTY